MQYDFYIYILLMIFSLLLFCWLRVKLRTCNIKFILTLICFSSSHPRSNSLRKLNAEKTTGQLYFKVSVITKKFDKIIFYIHVSVYENFID